MYKPRFTITPHLLGLLTRATEVRAWIKGAVVSVPWLPALQRDTAARLAHSSTAIEGNPLGLPEVEAIARGEETGSPAKDALEVKNHLAALRWLSNRTTLGERELLKMHSLLMAGLLPRTGYKDKQNRVVDHLGRTVYTPPGPEQARRLTRELLAWTAATDLHTVIVSAVAHHRLVSIHPFSDGNGRAARAYGTWVLHARGFDTEHILALDEFYEADRPRYYATLQQARDLDDDLTFWLEYVAEGVCETLLKTRSRIESLRVKAAAPGLSLTRRQEEVLRLLRDRGRLKSPDLESALGLTRARVAQILSPLLASGLVLREGRTRATSYRLP